MWNGVAGIEFIPTEYVCAGTTVAELWLIVSISFKCNEINNYVSL